MRKSNAILWIGMREINQGNKVLLREAVTGRLCIQQTTASRIQKHEFVPEEGSREQYTHGNQSSHISSYR